MSKDDMVDLVQRGRSR